MRDRMVDSYANEGMAQEVKQVPWLLAALDQIQKQESVLRNLLVPVHERLYGPQPSDEESKTPIDSIQSQVQQIDRRLVELIDCAREIHNAVC